MIAPGTLGARIIAVADAYHAIISDRPYRSRRTNCEATRELLRCSGGQFDPQVVDALLAVLETDDKLRALLPVESDGATAVSASVPTALPLPAARVKRGA